MKIFEKEENVTGEGWTDIRQDILAEEKKEEQGAFCGWFQACRRPKPTEAEAARTGEPTMLYSTAESD